MGHDVDYSKQYYVPHDSKWPIIAAIALFVFMIGMGNSFNAMKAGESTSFSSIIAIAGFALILYFVWNWFKDVINENSAGVNNAQVDRSYRMGMGWFIFSEVMLFGVFFGALFYARQYALPWLSGDGNNFFTNELLWKGFEGGWPNNGPDNVGGDFQGMGPFWLPTINTILLITSSFTLTIAHHKLLKNDMNKAFWWTIITVILGAIFMYCQIAEYSHAMHELNLKLGTGIYGNTFYMLTGLHGMHVTLGALMLFIMALRIRKGHFTPERHFGFMAAEWYWHFVDVVWILLYFFVYWM